MQNAIEATILGDFADAKLEYFGVATTFFRDGDRFMVRTDGPDGAPHDYPIAYTFGVYPLQQYLIAFPGGRLQALGIAWDSRSKEQGGQRWFHLYPGHQLKPGDPLHWTGHAYLPALLEPGLYHADGQIDGEVYECGSFLQSRM